MNAESAVRLWEAWRTRPFPTGRADVEVNAANHWPLAYLDAECAGCLARHFGGLGFQGGGLDDEYRQRLSSLRSDVALAVAAADASAQGYFQDLLSLVDHALASTGGDEVVSAASD